MQVNEHGSDDGREDRSPVSPSQRVRKSSRINDTRDRVLSLSSSAGRHDESRGPTSDPSSPRSTRKRAASALDTIIIRKEIGNADSPTDSNPPLSATSNASGELSAQICICQPEPKIPRPRNAFILYRQHHQQSIAANNAGLANPDISKIIGEQWKAESPENKAVWTALAHAEKAKHQEQYPDYRYQPRRLGRLGSFPQTQHASLERYRCSKCGGRTIHTPTSPFSTTSTSSTPVLPLPSVPDHPHLGRSLPPIGSMSLNSPALHRARPGPSNLSNIQVPPSPAYDNTSMYSPGGPEAKRRRYNAPPFSNGRRVEPTYWIRRESVPYSAQGRPSPSGPATMLPPPPRTPGDLRRQSLDISMLLTDQHDQSRSVEAMVMSVPYGVKIKVLGRITPPLEDPGPTSPSIAVRGAIIAIEGDDMDDVRELSTWLNDFFKKSGEYKPCIFEAPRLPKNDKKDVSFRDYLDLIKEWHARSMDMIRYITTPVDGSDSEDSDHDSQKAKAEGKGKEAAKDKDSDDSEMADSQDHSNVEKKPVIILPTYQLHASDVYTSRIPIQDAYSPTDHWQWMATLWRGTVGPDLTIYIRSPEAAPEKEGPATVPKLVDLHEDYRCLTVRKEKGNKISDSALRRVGFEVGEWVRDVAQKAGEN